MILHAGHHGLNGEVLVAQIDGDALVPEGRSHLVDRMAIVAGCVVHQHREGTELG